MRVREELKIENDLKQSRHRRSLFNTNPPKEQPLGFSMEQITKISPSISFGIVGDISQYKGTKRLKRFSAMTTFSNPEGYDSPAHKMEVKLEKPVVKKELTTKIVQVANYIETVKPIAPVEENHVELSPIQYKNDKTPSKDESQQYITFMPMNLPPSQINKHPSNYPVLYYTDQPKTTDKVNVDLLLYEKEVLTKKQEEKEKELENVKKELKNKMVKIENIKKQNRLIQATNDQLTKDVIKEKEKSKKLESDLKNMEVTKEKMKSTYMSTKEDIDKIEKLEQKLKEYYEIINSLKLRNSVLNREKKELEDKNKNLSNSVKPRSLYFNNSIPRLNSAINSSLTYEYYDNCL